MPQTLLLPIALFAVAAMAGLIMAVRLFGGKGSPLILSFLHAGFAASGVVTLYLMLKGTPVGGQTWLALGLYVAAAVGGLFLGSFRFRKSFPPKAVIVIHALVAISATTLLAGAHFGFLG